MKTILTGLLAATALGWGALAGAQTVPAPAVAAVTAPATVDADPALWVVKDADTTIYLFGTVHVLKPGLGWFDEAVKTAFDSSGELVLELVMPDPATMQALLMKTGFTASGPTLTEKMQAADRAAYVKAMTDLGIPTAAFDRADPWVAAVDLALLPILKLGYNPANGPEALLSAAAKTAGKTVSGLETAEQQFGYFDSLAEPVQLKFLASTVKDLPKTAEVIDNMVASWAKGDPDTLAATMNEGMEDLPEINAVLLKGRNVRWADWIDARLKRPGTVFLAVGAGHLAGKDSVQVQLAGHKLKAQRIAY